MSMADLQGDAVGQCSPIICRTARYSHLALAHEEVSYIYFMFGTKMQSRQIFFCVIVDNKKSNVNVAHKLTT